ncbi:MAG: hypothetical protein RLZZ490_1320 [Cyanobacteriota bacterium]|jgi:flagellar basal body-associated protein FliL
MFKPSKLFDQFFLKVGNFQNKNEPVLDLSRVLPIVGYLLIFMTLVDFANAILPLRLQNPEWELTTLDRLSNHSWSLLMGTGFILTGFFGSALGRVHLIEVRILMIIRWGLLLLGILYILSLPLVFTNTNRLMNQIKTNISQESQARLQLIDQVDANIGGINNPNQLLQITQTLGLPITNPNAPPEQLKQQIQQQLPQLRQQITERAAQAESTQVKTLIKSSLRTAIQLMVIALGNGWIWFKTHKIKLFLL